MSIRTKTELILAGTLVAMAGLFYAVSLVALGGSFGDLETDAAERDTRRFLNAFKAELSNLESVTTDWASWDDTYKYVEDINEDYAESNLVEGTFIGLRLNGLILVNRPGEVVYGQGFDLEEEEFVDISDELLGEIDILSSLQFRTDATADDGTTGLLIVDGTRLIVSSQPVLMSDDMGPMRGSLMMVRVLDDREITRLGDQTQLAVTALPTTDPSLPAAVKDMLADSSRIGSVIVVPEDQDTIAGYAVASGISGSPGLVFKSETPRDIYAQGQSTIRYILLSILGTGLVLGVASVLLTQRLVLSRLTRLSHQVEEIGESPSARIDVSGDDELAGVATAINRMLDELDTHSRELVEAETTKVRQQAAEARLAELQRSRERIVTVAESLRRDIAINIHGTIQNRLILLMIELQELSKKTSSEPVSAALVDIHTRLQTLIEGELRDVTTQLYPAILRRGLVPALQSLCDRFESQLEINLDWDKNIEAEEKRSSGFIPEDIRLSAYRIVEEALTNTLKHAQASTVSISLRNPDHSIIVVVRDDGAGFDMDDVSAGMGIGTMKDYSEVVGGDCAISSKPGEGTTTTATLPFTARNR